MIDRPMRPMFPEDFRNEVQVVNTVLSNDPSCSTAMAAMIGSSIALMISDIPFEGPIAGVVVGKVNGNLIINPTPLDEGARSSLTIILKHKRKTQTIFIGKSQEEEDKENPKKKKKHKKEEKKENKKESKKEKKKNEKKGKKEEEEEEEEDEESEDDADEDEDEEEEKKEDDYEETEAMKDKKIPKFKRSSSILVNLNPTYTKYDLVYINYVDLKKIPGDFKLRDLLELLKFFKSKGSTLFVNF
jgi:polyribonucleotide nucleotidyltransferase